MTTLVRLTQNRNGLPVMVRPESIDSIQELPADKEATDRTVIMANGGKCFLVVNETIEEILKACHEERH